MDASEINDPELRASRHWVWAMIAIGAVAFAAGIRAAPPVVFVHAENAEQRSKTAGSEEKKKEPKANEENEESGETDRGAMLPWLYLMKR